MQDNFIDFWDIPKEDLQSSRTSARSVSRDSWNIGGSCASASNSSTVFSGRVVGAKNATGLYKEDFGKRKVGFTRDEQDAASEDPTSGGAAFYGKRIGEKAPYKPEFEDANRNGLEIVARPKVQEANRFERQSDVESTFDPFSARKSSPKRSAEDSSDNIPKFLDDDFDQSFSRGYADPYSAFSVPHSAFNAPSPSSSSFEHNTWTYETALTNSCVKSGDSLSSIDLKPFLVVTCIIKDSPAFFAELEEGDLILKFGCFDYCNCPKSLKTLYEYIQERDGVEFPVVVQKTKRTNRSIRELKIKPGNWKHGAVIGMVVNSFPKPAPHSSCRRHR